MARRLLEAPHRDTFIHRQTLANAMRFTTAELAELEGRIAKAHDAALAHRSGDLRPPARCRAAPKPTGSAPSPMRWPQLDVAAALAQLATTRNFCRPAGR